MQIYLFFESSLSDFPDLVVVPFYPRDKVIKILTGCNFRVFELLIPSTRLKISIFAVFLLLDATVVYSISARQDVH